MSCAHTVSWMPQHCCCQCLVVYIAYFLKLATSKPLALNEGGRIIRIRMSKSFTCILPVLVTCNVHFSTPATRALVHHERLLHHPCNLSPVKKKTIICTGNTNTMLTCLKHVSCCQRLALVRNVLHEMSGVGGTCWPPMAGSCCLWPRET